MTCILIIWQPEYIFATLRAPVARQTDGQTNRSQNFLTVLENVKNIIDDGILRKMNQTDTKIGLTQKYDDSNNNNNPQF